MSWRRAADLVLEEAEVAERQANALMHGLDPASEAALKRYLHAVPDIKALDGWTERRIARGVALALHRVYARLAAAASEDVTVLARAPKG